MNGLHIQQVFVAGFLFGFLYDEEDVEGVTIYNLTICVTIIGIRISWW